MPKPKTNDIDKWRADPLLFLSTQIILENGKPLGECWDEWQREDFVGMLSHANACLTRPRGHSKTGDVGSLLVFFLICGLPHKPQGVQMYSCAVDIEQARILHKDVADKLQRNPRLAPLVKITANTITVLASGNTYTAISSDAGSAMGLRPDALVCDEMGEWKSQAERMWITMWTASAKIAGSKTIIISTPGSRNGVLAKTLAGIQNEPSWYVKARGFVASWIDRDRVAQIERTTTRPDFERYMLGQWVDQVGAYFSHDEIEKIFVDELPYSTYRGFAIGVDLATRHDRAAVAVVGSRAEDGLAEVIDLCVYDPEDDGGKVNLQQVENDIAMLAKKYDNALVLYDPHQAALMAQQLGAMGVTAEEYTIGETTRKKLFSKLLYVIRHDQLRCEIDPEDCDVEDMLKDELLGLHIEEKDSGAWRVDHIRGEHDDCVWSVMLALEGLSRVPATPVGSYDEDVMLDQNFLDWFSNKPLTEGDLRW